MKAGDAIIYDHRLIHGSPPNLSNKVRLAINMVYIAKESMPVHYVFKNSEVKMFEVNKDFFHSCMTCNETEMTNYNVREFIKIQNNYILQEEINGLVQ
jgi:hypothetical protein